MKLLKFFQVSSLDSRFSLIIIIKKTHFSVLKTQLFCEGFSIEHFGLGCSFHLFNRKNIFHQNVTLIALKIKKEAKRLKQKFFTRLCFTLQILYFDFYTFFLYLYSASTRVTHLIAQLKDNVHFILKLQSVSMSLILPPLSPKTMSLMNMSILLSTRHSSNAQ